MPVMYYIPWLDIFLGLIFLGLIALGFWQGMLRELWFLIAIYLSAILAALAGNAVAGFIQNRWGAAPEVASTWGFFFIIALGTAIIYSILYALVGQLRLPSSLLTLDKIGGVVLGLVTSFLVTTFLAFMLNALIPVGPEEWAFSAALQTQRLTSPLLRLFLRSRPVVLATIEVWLPRDITMPYFLELEMP